MTIGIDCRLYSPHYTGIGRYVYEMVKHLIELDQQNRYVLFFNQKEFDEFQVPNERWEKRLVNIPHYSLAEQWKFYRMLKQEKLDLMHFPHFNAPILYKKPFVVTIHDLTLHYYPYKEYQPKWTLKKGIQIFFYRFLMGQVVKHAKQIIAVSENTKKDLIKEYSVSSQKISKVLEGVPEHFQKSTPDQIETVRQKFGMTKTYLLYTGVWRSHKNLLNLIKAFKLLTDQGHDLQLVLTGKKDPVYPEIPQLIEELFPIPNEFSEESLAKAMPRDSSTASSSAPTPGLDRYSSGGLRSEWKNHDRVVLTGFVSDEELISLMSGASVYVFPSLYEGFGLPPLEAMQLGVPVACSNTSSLPEVCHDAALYFDPKNVKEMAESIQKILKNPELRQELIENGQKNLLRFSWRGMTSQILDIYNKVC
ncbi:MAG: glycosyltransferase family 4 protein [Candidatus Altimarinota bacterium]